MKVKETFRKFFGHKAVKTTAQIIGLAGAFVLLPKTMLLITVFGIGRAIGQGINEKGAVDIAEKIKSGELRILSK
jgi:hypothetical protein